MIYSLFNMKKILFISLLLLSSCSTDEVAKLSDDLNNKVQHMTNPPKPTDAGTVIIGTDSIDFTNIDSTLTTDDILYYVRYTHLKSRELYRANFKAFDAFITSTGRNNLMVCLKYTSSWYPGTLGEDILMMAEIHFDRNSRQPIEQYYTELVE